MIFWSCQKELLLDGKYRFRDHKLEIPDECDDDIRALRRHWHFNVTFFQAEITGKPPVKIPAGNDGVTIDPGFSAVIRRKREKLSRKGAPAKAPVREKNPEELSWEQARREQMAQANNAGVQAPDPVKANRRKDGNVPEKQIAYQNSIRAKRGMSKLIGKGRTHGMHDDKNPPAGGNPGRTRGTGRRKDVAK